MRTYGQTPMSPAMRTFSYWPSGNVLAAVVTLQQALWPPLLEFSTAITQAPAPTSLGILIFLSLRLLQ